MNKDWLIEREIKEEEDVSVIYLSDYSFAFLGLISFCFYGFYVDAFVRYPQILYHE